MRGFLSRHSFYSTVVPSPYRVPVAALATVLVFQGFLSGLAALLLLPNQFTDDEKKSSNPKYTKWVKTKQLLVSWINATSGWKGQGAVGCQSLFFYAACSYLPSAHYSLCYNERTKWQTIESMALCLTRSGKYFFDAAHTVLFNSSKSMSEISTLSNSAVFNPMRSQSMHDEELPTGNQLTSDSGEAKSAFTFNCDLPLGAIKLREHYWAVAYRRPLSNRKDGRNIPRKEAEVKYKGPHLRDLLTEERLMSCLLSCVSYDGLLANVTSRGRACYELPVDQVLIKQRIFRSTSRARCWVAWNYWCPSPKKERRGIAKAKAMEARLSPCGEGAKVFSRRAQDDNLIDYSEERAYYLPELALPPPYSFEDDQANSSSLQVQNGLVVPETELAHRLDSLTSLKSVANRL
ncbi:hypothetical protein KY290_006775 [Solanum tuberosum]|uniref:Uncharacterized protein n=1 Tax=Solanum tuberosum TaxID=4113 RepID=A0ABQ7WI24_SOLTU|nr:hypothetical protein KY289_018613 [Solanum tuberosum]KAH0722514.1 hypothetical protein KY289_005558 [Solanum tuberosum]KAH0751897.1 hypothetical protein KY285_005045 [Solanum tuberosum]KAH0778735.1 hypothetical protein KY290_005162 [Solanum tuberosum]KAH0780348.1 hypothetical protein KY290_006775 [Solanum tuberosum]